MLNKIFASATAMCLLITAASTPVSAFADGIISDPADSGEYTYIMDSFSGIYGTTADGETEEEEERVLPPLPEDKSVVTVMIDPGHYGYYNRSAVYPSYYESVMTWKLSNYLKTELEKLGAFATLTKTSLDDNPGLLDRGYMSEGYDFFISMHSNAASYSSMDKPISLCYQDLDWTTIDDTSREIGYLLADKVAEVMNTNQGGEIFQRLSDNDRDGNGTEDDEWYGVLAGARYVNTPGILLEHSFHTNYRATVWLSNDSNLQKMAKEEAAVIYDYFTKKKAQEAADALTATTTSATTVSTTSTTVTTVREDPVPREDWIAGDVDGNGDISLSDASRVLEYYSEKSAGMNARFIKLSNDDSGELLVFSAADIIHDETINIDDATEILSVYAESATGK